MDLYDSLPPPGPSLKKQKKKHNTAESAEVKANLVGSQQHFTGSGEVGETRPETYDDKLRRLCAFLLIDRKFYQGVEEILILTKGHDSTDGVKNECESSGRLTLKSFLHVVYPCFQVVLTDLYSLPNNELVRKKRMLTDVTVMKADIASNYPNLAQYIGQHREQLIENSLSPVPTNATAGLGYSVLIHLMIDHYMKETEAISDYQYLRESWRLIAVTFETLRCDDNFAFRKSLKPILLHCKSLKDDWESFSQCQRIGFGTQDSLSGFGNVDSIWLLVNRFTILVSMLSTVYQKYYEKYPWSRDVINECIGSISKQRVFMMSHESLTSSPRTNSETENGSEEKKTVSESVEMKNVSSPWNKNYRDDSALSAGVEALDILVNRVSETQRRLSAASYAHSHSAAGSSGTSELSARTVRVTHSSAHPMRSKQGGVLK